ncbi:DEAD/DEAH box helicase family protein [Corynebacterium hadale]|uniref:DEAD/DEAH box helicase family protein n=1 Tax=Corynebacterium hadale TaxID=2026255 RepID=UPI000BAA953A|nr:DEAD/DEAH box helicase family protein [Corynebacterium hadale]PAT13586.1 hypothetical protein CKJ83_01760 [Corynebacterium hadale]
MQGRVALLRFGDKNMNLDWSGFDAKGPQVQVNPREIFNATANKSITRLRSEQTEVLDQWFERRSEKDLVIKQNTGSGKTIVGLLIARSCQAELGKPVVYLVPDRFLVQQVVHEAARINVAVTSEFDTNFELSEAIFVTTFKKMFNGRSVFGAPGGRRNPLDLGAVIIDDAHSALGVVAEQFSIRVPRSSVYFEKLFELFKHDLERQDLKVTKDIQSENFSSAVRVSPHAVNSGRAQLGDLLAEAADNEDEFEWAFFAWHFIANHLAISSVTFTSREIDIRLPCSDIAALPSFCLAERKVYLTATMQNEGALVADFGADPKSVSKPITPESAADIGDRLILAPRIYDQSCTDTVVRKYAKQISLGADGRKAENVVVLVPSRYAAQQWHELADHVVTIDDMRPLLNQMREGHHVGLVVLINKYDGVDLPGDACRLLIIDGLHHPLNPFELRRSRALAKTAVHDDWLLQRLEQGMGRGVRDTSDYCAVLVIERDAALAMHKFFRKRMFSPATQAQIAFSTDVVKHFAEGSFEETKTLLSLFLAGNAEFMQRSRQSVAGVKYELDSEISQVDRKRRQAFELALNGDHGKAAERIQDAVDLDVDPQLKGWLLEEKATYQEIVDEIAADNTLTGAFKKNRSCVKPREANSRIVDPPSASGQAAKASAYLRREFTDFTNLKIQAASFKDGIKWGVPGTADASENVIEEIGCFLGFDSRRPERDDRDGGPDNLWITDGRAFVIELKTAVERESPEITKTEAAQLLSSLQWFRNKFPGLPEPTPVLIHPARKMHDLANLPANSLLVDKEAYEKLAGRIADFGKEVADQHLLGSHTEVQRALQRHALTADRMLRCKGIRR